MPDARDLAQLRVEAEDIARKAGQDLTTVHLLLAVFTVQCPAKILLEERGVDEMRLLAALSAAPKEPAPRLVELLQRTREIAAGLGVESDSLHLLIALSRSKDTLAYDLLRACAVPLSMLRNTILSWYTSGSIPRQYLHKDPPQAPLTAHTPPRKKWSVESRPLTGRCQPKAKPAPRPGARSEPPKEAARPKEAPKEAPPPTPQQRPVIEATPGVPPPPLADPAEAPVLAPTISEAPSGFDPLAFPNLSALGRNLTEAAQQGKLDPLIGRAREVEAAVDILGKRRGNNPILIGEPGVGKTAIAEGVAQRLVELGSPKTIMELETSQLVAGTSLRGAFAERLEAIKDEMRKAAGSIVLFIDEIHTLVGAGAAGDGAQDAANGLKTALARGELPCIGATTHDEYRKFIEADPALERRLTPVIVEEPSLDEAKEIVAGLAGRYATHHKVLYAEEALEAAVQFCGKHIRDRQLPDSAIQAIDLAGSRASRKARRAVDVEEIAAVVAEMARIPVEQVLLEDTSRLLTLEAALSERIIGHREAVADVSRTLRRNYAGFASHRPMGSFLFLGPTGVGKTEFAKVLADTLFGKRGSLLRFDMSEFSEAHGVSRLVGAPPGYVGHGEGGQLTEPLRRSPAKVVLFDEVEKAHRDVWMLLLQILDEGKLTDGNGRDVDFSQTVVILTSNLGADAFAKGGGAMGFGRGDEATERRTRALELARAQLPPELWNRLDERCLFAPLGREEVGAIAGLLLEDSASRLWEEKRIGVDFDPSVVELLLERGGFDEKLGARPMRRAVQRLVEAPLAEAILRGEIGPGASLAASVETDEEGPTLVFTELEQGQEEAVE